jgi:DNA-binding beta-propeller fold protein YncE
MLVSESFEGSRIPFEGDRVLTLHSLPEGAQVTSATVKLSPIAPPGGVLFEERILFDEEQGDWGARLRKSNPADDPQFVEVDFHARRTLSSVTGTGLNDASLQVDVGGLYIQINKLGTMVTPDDDSTDYFTLTDPAGGLLPSLATQKFKLSKIIPANLQISQVGIRSAPSNLTLRLESQPSFWARPGELTHSESAPDFSVILNAFLAEASVENGYYIIPLTLHSDTLCRVNVDVDIAFIQKLPALPGGISEVALEFDHSTLPKGESGVISVELPAGARVLPGETTARVRGSFGNSRVVYGPTGQFDPAGTVEVTPDRAQASPLIFSENLALSSLDLLLTSTSRTAELAVDLVVDLDGKPAPDSVLPAQVNLGIDSQIAGKPTWFNVSLPVEVQINAGTRAWLVVQSLHGDAGWSVISQEQVGAASVNKVWSAGDAVAVDQANGSLLGIQYTDTGGLSWHTENTPGVSGPLAGMVHLRQPSKSYQVPITLQVGDGENANRVDLSRFQPLGRVDFNLDFAEFAEAINQAALDSAATVPPTGEHLLNNEFEAWRRVGNTPRRNVMRVPTGHYPARGLALSPDGSLLYIATMTSDTSTEMTSIGFAAVETACHQLEYEFLIAAVGGLSTEEVVVEFNGLAVNPDGRRACISWTAVENHFLSWIDLESHQVVGPIARVSGLTGKPVFSPDGSRLYLMSYDDNIGSIRVLDSGHLDEIFLSGGNVEDAEMLSIDIGGNQEPFVQILSPDGERLYVVVFDHGDPQTSEIRVYDLATGSWMAPIGLGGAEEDQFNLALNPDGSRIVVTNHSSQDVRVFETRRGRSIGQISTAEQGSPVAVVVDPDGLLAYVAIADEINTIAAFDISRLSQGFIRSDIQLSSIPYDLAILPSGERLYVANGVQLGELYSSDALALGAMTPEEWTLTSGTVQPVCVDDPYHRSAVLGDFSCQMAMFERSLLLEGEPQARTFTASAISQVVPVVAGVHYGLSFWGLATTSEVVAEVIWYGDNCNLQQTDLLPFSAFSGDPDEMKCALEGLILSGEMVDVGKYILSHRLEMTSPAGAKLAEVRFTVPANEVAFLDRISLQATANALANGDLQHLEEDRLVGWRLNPEGAGGVTLMAEATGLRIRNNGTREAALEQIAEFPAETPFELSFTGQAEVSGAGTNPRLEVIWMDAQNARLSSPLSAGINPQSSSQVTRRGDSPTGTLSVMLRVVAPPGTSLLLQEVKFEEVSITKVPVYVIAQAPGDINVSDMQVVYDVPLPTPPKTLPPGGLCPATPPTGAPGQQRRGCCYCPNCGETDDLCNVHATETPGGQPALEGECCHCGARQPSIGSGGEEITASIAESRPTSITMEPAVEVRRVLARPEVSRRRRAAILPTSRELLLLGEPISGRAADAAVSTSLPVSAAEWAILAAGLVTETTSLQRITDIGDKREIALRNLGIISLPHLAEAKEETIANLPGISEAMARNMIAEAKSILEHPEELPIPLVSCIMPTADQPILVAKAIEYFQRQDYPNCELLILDDGENPVNGLVPDDERIRYIKLPTPQSLSAKRNRGCQEAEGVILANWQDDQWIAPWRLSYQVAALLKGDAEVCGLENLLHYSLLSGEAWVSMSPPELKPSLHSSTLCFRKSFWEHNPFHESRSGGDTLFLQQPSPARVLTLQSLGWLVDIVREAGFKPVGPNGMQQRPFPPDKIRELLGSDWEFYTNLVTTPNVG